MINPDLGDLVDRDSTLTQSSLEMLSCNSFENWLEIGVMYCPPPGEGNGEAAGEGPGELGEGGYTAAKLRVEIIWGASVDICSEEDLASVFAERAGNLVAVPVNFSVESLTSPSCHKISAMNRNSLHERDIDGRTH